GASRRGARPGLPRCPGRRRRGGREPDGRILVRRCSCAGCISTCLYTQADSSWYRRAMDEPLAVGRLLKRVQYRNHRALDRALAEIGTTLVQWDALRVISEQPSSAAHALAVAPFQSDQSFGTLATRLEDQGLIRRTPGRGRAVEHRLTPSGAKMLA